MCDDEPSFVFLTVLIWFFLGTWYMSKTRFLWWDDRLQTLVSGWSCKSITLLANRLLLRRKSADMVSPWLQTVPKPRCLAVAQHIQRRTFILFIPLLSRSSRARAHSVPQTADKGAKATSNYSAPGNLWNVRITRSADKPFGWFPLNRSHKRRMRSRSENKSHLDLITTGSRRRFGQDDTVSAQTQR